MGPAMLGSSRASPMRPPPALARGPAFFPGWKWKGLEVRWAGRMLERDWGSTGSVPPCLQEVTLPQCPAVLSPAPHLHPMPAPGAVRCLCSGLRLHGPSLGSGSWCRGEWMCHSLSWQGTNDGRKALAVPGLPLPPLRCCWLLLPACTLARAAQPGMGAVGRPRTWGNQLRLSHVTATLGNSPVPWVKRVPTARLVARRRVPLPGQ